MTKAERRSPRARRAALLAVLAVVAAPGAAHAALPTVYDFASVKAPGAVSTTPFSISNAGLIVGFYSRGPSIAGDIRGTPVHGFVRRPRAKRAVDIAALPAIRARRRRVPMSNISAIGLDPDGRILGQYEAAGGKRRSFLLSANGRRLTVIHHLNGSGTSAFDMNDFGQIVGFFFDRASPDAPSAHERIAHGFVRSRRDRFTEFDDPDGVGKTYPQSIDDDGVIVGHIIDGSGKIRSFIRSADGRRFVHFDHPEATGEGAGTGAQAINARGEIAGLFFTSTSSHGFVRSADGRSFNVIDHPAGVGTTSLFGLNDRGQVVGYYVDARGRNHGFVATPRR